MQAGEAFREALNNDPGYERAIANLQRVQDKMDEQSVTSSLSEAELDEVGGQKGDSLTRSSEGTKQQTPLRQ